jgi:hypothetical protein
MRRALLLLPLLLPSAAGAQTRPLQTEEADTGRAGRLVLEVGAELARGEPNFLTGGRRDVWDAPVLRLSWSPADPVQVDIGWTGRIVALRDPEFGTASDYGDVVLRTKLRLVERRSDRVGVSARFGVLLPETNSLKGLGPNTLRMGAELLLSRQFGAFGVHANVGLAIQDRPLEIHEQSDFLSYGLALVQRLGPDTSVMMEAAGLGVGPGVPGADQHSEVRAGVRRRLGRVVGDIALRRGLSPADGHWGVTFGVSWVMRGGGT